MLGWSLLRDAELALRQEINDRELKALVAELNAAKEYIRKCEALIEHERSRIDAERERADRTTDALLQQNGLPATTATVRRELEIAEAEANEKRADYQKELYEIYGESMDDLIDDGVEPLSEPIQAVAAELTSK
jgi:hypothetical protein